MLNYNEIGISKSRNRCLENAIGDICLLSDDDVIYKSNIIDTITKAFNNNPQADVITFQIVTCSGKLYKKYPPNSLWHNKRSILKVSSIEVAFKTESVINNNIKFDEKFGLGSKYCNGEENIFLMDCLRSGLKIKYVPIPIVIHEEISSACVLDEKNIYSKGALFFRLYKYNAIILNIIFLIKKYKDLRVNLFKSILLIYKGLNDYVNEIK